MNTQHTKVSVVAPARLHMGFMDLSGLLGRHFGSIGVALTEINTRLTLTAAADLRFSGLPSARFEKCTQRLCAVLDVSTNLHIHLEALIPEHVGLGSGTQMALAIGSALNAFYDLNLTVRDIAQLGDRGARSGIGVGVFEQGGLVVDGGRGAQTTVPPIISRLDVPEDWQFILVFDQRGQGLHGEQEISAFSKLPPFPQAEAQKLCYLLLMQALPAVAEGNLTQFGEVITQLQASVGGHFAAAQGGVFASTEVAQVMHWLAQHGAVAIGQTSWGPTGFCAVAGENAAQSLVNDIQQRFAHFQNLSFMLTGVRNHGAQVLVE